MSDANILAICGEETSVGKWVVKNGLGLTVKSNINEIVSVFFDIENGKYENYFDSTRRSILKEKLNFDFYEILIFKSIFFNITINYSIFK